MTRTAEIKLTVDLDGESVPTNIRWVASESPEDGPQTAQSMMLSLWDCDKQSIAAIDLWTRDTTVDDMNLYFYEAFNKMADTYLRATRNEDVAALIHDFGGRFGKALGLR
ncbi:MAG: gliding motility protein GldC [Woeseiaceae bacterium]